MLDTFKKVVLSAVILAVVFGLLGVAYVRFGSSPPPKKTETAAAPTQQYRPLPAPSKPNPNHPVGVALQSLISPVKAGMNSSIDVHTTALATCTISVTYNNTPSKDSGLVTKQADEYGQASWTWTVPASAPAGTWPVKVDCKYATHSGELIGKLVVTK